MGREYVATVAEGGKQKVITFLTADTNFDLRYVVERTGELNSLGAEVPGLLVLRRCAASLRRAMFGGRRYSLASARARLLEG
jgi:hypothetical protein